jgi:hypothetical protein
MTADKIELVYCPSAKKDKLNLISFTFSPSLGDSRSVQNHERRQTKRTAGLSRSSARRGRGRCLLVGTGHQEGCMLGTVTTVHRIVGDR